MQNRYQRLVFGFLHNFPSSVVTVSMRTKHFTASTNSSAAYTDMGAWAKPPPEWATTHPIAPDDMSVYHRRCMQLVWVNLTGDPVPAVLALHLHGHEINGEEPRLLRGAQHNVTIGRRDNLGNTAKVAVLAPREPEGRLGQAQTPLELPLLHGMPRLLLYIDPELVTDQAGELHNLRVHYLPVVDDEPVVETVVRTPNSEKIAYLEFQTSRFAILIFLTLTS